MKILIIGGTSSLGAALKIALSVSDEVITAGRNNCDIAMDLNDPVEKIDFPKDIDVVVHTAADFGGKNSSEIVQCENVNVIGTLKLCQLAVKENIKHFILISSIFATLYENSEYFGIYALSKRHAEEAAEFFCSTSSLLLTILRPSQIYGTLDSFRKHQPFFYTLVGKAEKGEEIMLYGNNDALRNYIHVDDLVTIISLVIRKKIGGKYSCVHPQDLPYSRIAKAALSAFKSKGSVRFLKDKADISDNVFEKDDSLYKKINFYPRISIEEGMRMIAKHRSINN